MKEEIHITGDSLHTVLSKKQIIERALISEKDILQNRTVSLKKARQEFLQWSRNKKGK
jgi:hypothetical protein